MLTTIRLFFAKAPGWAWLALLALIIAGLLYLAGARHQAKKDHGAAVRDSVHVERAAVDTDAKRSAVAIADADTHEKKAAPLRDRARVAIADTSNHVPAAVIAVVDSALAEDATTIAKKDDAIAAQHTEILARVELDTLTQHQLVFKPPGDGLSVGDVVKDVAIIAVIVEIAVQILRFLRGQ